MYVNLKKTKKLAISKFFSCTARLVCQNNLLSRIRHNSIKATLKALILICLMMLPSGPDMIHSKTMYKTLTSTLHLNTHPKNWSAGLTLQSCYSGLQVQGTASSPPSAVK